jgi:hypothetical protein
MYNYEPGASACKMSINLAVRRVTRVRSFIHLQEYTGNVDNDLNIRVETLKS